ncbi:hypothetical protein [Wenxinia marina]|uniref:Uncharacterized protein n=1 Tax=Wenxinia marina DSM 24838 TaxID=1123501 RepID=A0A0D0PZE9_9RHOB|nr:hypothetical protein [Wenxinia marina]KIQ67709.1 hypothetical protein Wenmar_03668 [Wenxinia marina DSM 24838]GGL77747.1 hypothetical protein GCM10011392_35380 [Wenxinia marina]
MQLATIVDRFGQVSRRPRLLVVGTPDQWAAADIADADRNWLALCPFADLDTCTLDEWNPDLVVSHLLSAEYDVIEVARRLNELGYAGSYVAIWRRVPNPAVIKAEVRQVAPGLPFEVLELSD